MNFTQLSLGLTALFVLTPLSAAAGGGVYTMQDGLLVVEFESLDSSGYWALEDGVGGYTGSAYLRWAGPNHFDEPGNDPFAVEFMVEEAGTYDFRIRNHHDNPDSTEANDVWVRMDGGAWLKVFSGIKNQWTWASNQELGPDDKPPASYELSAGEHRLEFSGRSFDFRMDRLHLFTPGHPDGTNAAAPESDKVIPNLRPVAKLRLNPPTIPADDQGETVVILDARQSFDPEGGPLKFHWHVRGGQFVQGTSETSEVAKVRFARSGYAQPVRLTVTDEHEQGALGSSTTAALGVDGSLAEVRGEPVAWHPLELWFQGPNTNENATAPNPFLDYRLEVTWTGPAGQVYRVPGFYAGNGKGGGSGNIWKCRFAADSGGKWTWRASFRIGEQVAVDLNPLAGDGLAFDNATGEVALLDRQADADGFLADGRLEHVGKHYLRFRDGGWFIKGGTNSPENLLGYAGFDDVKDAGGVGIVHNYASHVDDWRPGDPYFVSNDKGVSSKGIIGVLNYLGHQGVNSVYFLPMNLGGDGQETYPFVGNAPTDHDRTHYDISRLHQWAQVMDHAQRCRVLLHFVLAETEYGNETWLDGGELGVQRKLFYRELIARFSSAMAIKWNLSEENDYTVQQLEQFAGYIRAVDPYDHPIAVHTHPNNFQDYPYLLGSPLFEATSVQFDPNLAGGQVEEWREKSAAAGKPWILDMDENGSWNIGLSDSNADQMRKQVLYDVYFSGGQLEWYAGYHDLPLGGDVKMEDFRTRQPMWRYMSIARQFMLDNLPFWEMEPADELVTGEHQAWGGAECFAKLGEVYAIYIPKGTIAAQLDLSRVSGKFSQRWFNPRSGEFEGDRRLLTGGKKRLLAAPPGLHQEDWVVLVERMN
jgi:Domain of unknown function (DUF5060)/Putative collagen-binding domain of a collagenase